MEPEVTEGAEDDLLDFLFDDDEDDYDDFDEVTVLVPRGRGFTLTVFGVDDE